ncbi:hypothetical protein PR003_g17444 [Phytophthora rubi]|uniref:Uncharacterized protein n=1 Tax=Phytophthora rubi TaxID=129364 RepID=A0A6A3IPK1_9STRA|nr:hypothetical protein PR001_g23655 [Phytophthora rubi]KAE9007169.1 hypothetical protein PR002_g16282 [Phytophthora rubi]KAE9321540.1 hypothetical protein PR003_g17444 [Phytophthora rubi]
MSKYDNADAKFFVSGQNSEEFFNFCEGSLDVLYLKACLDIKLELRDYVRGGMRQEDEVDSLDPQNSSHSTTTGRASKWQDGILKTINRLADIVAGSRNPAAAPVTALAANIPATVQAQDEDMLIDRIGKLHHLIEQVKEQEGQTDAALANSLALSAALTTLRNRLAALE